jgi:hypothetical protein
MTFWFQNEDLTMHEEKPGYGYGYDKVINDLRETVNDLREDKRRLITDNNELRERLGLGKVGS